MDVAQAMLVAGQRHGYSAYTTGCRCRYRADKQAKLHRIEATRHG